MLKPLQSEHILPSLSGHVIPSCHQITKCRTKQGDKYNQGSWTCCSRQESGSCLTKKTIQNGVTGVVCLGELLAMPGPLGSGKTTLLTALGGCLTKNTS